MGPIDNHVEDNLEEQVFSLLEPRMEGWTRGKKVLKFEKVRALSTVHPMYTYPKHVAFWQGEIAID